MLRGNTLLIFKIINIWFINGYNKRRDHALTKSIDQKTKNEYYVTTKPSDPNTTNYNQILSTKQSESLLKSALNEQVPLRLSLKKVLLRNI